MVKIADIAYELTTELADDDLLVAVDTSDTTESADGTTVKIEYQYIKKDITVKTDKLITVNEHTGTSETLALTDADDWNEYNNGSAITLTVPTNASVAFPIGTQIVIQQTGAGLLTVAAAGGVTIQSYDSALAMSGQYATATLVKKATDTWSLQGAITT